MEAVRLVRNWFLETAFRRPHFLLLKSQIQKVLFENDFLQITFLVTQKSFSESHFSKVVSQKHFLVKSAIKQFVDKTRQKVKFGNDFSSFKGHFPSWISLFLRPQDEKSDFSNPYVAKEEVAIL